MKIAIIGGGWVGCHLLSKFRQKYDCTLFEKNDKLFLETSYKNQNRLHLGYHYARSSKTRELCYNTFDKFIQEYGFAIQEIENCVYSIPKNNSNIDFETYVDIFRKYDFKKVQLASLKNIEGSIRVNEKLIDYKKIHDYFNTELKNNCVFNSKKTIVELSNQYDLIINATNNFINCNQNSFYELTITLIYYLKNKIEFGSLTLVDGNLFSIYKLNNEGLYTLTDVEHTPIKKFKNISDLKEFEKNINEEFIKNKRHKIENKILKYYPNFKNDFQYNSYFLSVKSKLNDKSDNRYPIIIKDKNVINCFTGKIQGIYPIESSIKQIIDESINWL